MQIRFDEKRFGPSGLAFVLAVWFGFVSVGCPGGSGEGGPVEECGSIGEQCRLGAGKLGVCTMDPQGELECVPQH